MAHSLLMIPVPRLDPVVRARLAQCSPELLPGRPEDVVAHVTLLGPFAALDHLTPGLLSELATFFSDVTPFVFTLTTVNQFPGGTVYLAPSPAAPFRQLTHALARRFPEYPPYGGAFDEVVPHLSLPLLEDETVEQVETAVGTMLPMTLQAREAALFWWEPGESRTLETFEFGTSAA